MAAVNSLSIGMRDGGAQQVNKTGVGGNVLASLSASAVAALVDDFITAAKVLQNGAGVDGASVSMPLPLDAASVFAPTAGGENERSKKWAIRCKDSLNNIKTHYLPCAKFSLITTLGVEDLDLTVTANAAFVTAFEALFVDAVGGALTVERIYKANS